MLTYHPPLTNSQEATHLFYLFIPKWVELHTQKHLGQSKIEKQAQTKQRKVRASMENNSVTQSAPMGFLLLEEVQFLEVKDDVLSQWEFVDVLDTEEGGENDDDWSCVEDGFGSRESSKSLPISPNDDPISETRFGVLYPDADLKVHHEFDVDDGNGGRHFPDYGGEDGRECQFDCEDSDGHSEEKADDDDDDQEQDDNGYDLDDELVPWSVSCKFGRQRMRKLGKRACSKMNNSKRNPYLFVRPGCVRGKHGLGLKHNF